jgi:chromosome segregation ATPase
VDRITTSVDDSLAALRDPEVGLAELDRHFAEAGARFETIIGELRDLVRILPTAAPQGSGEVVSQLEELRAEAAAAAERIERLEAQPSIGVESPAAVEHLERELAGLRSRLQHFAIPDEIASQLDALRLSTSTVAVRIERIEDLAARTAENASSSASRIGADLAALARKVENFERREDGLLAEVERAQALWPVALRSLEARLDDIVAKQDDLGPKDANGGSLLAALHASLAAMQAVAAETQEATDLPSSGSPPTNGGHAAAAPPKARARRTKA